MGLSEGRDYWYSQGTHGVAVFKLNEGENFSDEGKIFVSPEGRFLLAHIYRRSLAGNGSGQALRASGGFGDQHDIGRIFSHRNSNLVALLSVDGRIYRMSSYDRSIVDPEATDVDGDLLSLTAAIAGGTRDARRRHSRACERTGSAS